MKRIKKVYFKVANVNEVTTTDLYNHLQIVQKCNQVVELLGKSFEYCKVEIKDETLTETFIIEVSQKPKEGFSTKEI